MKKIVINDICYEIIRNDKDCIDTDELSEKITDYFDDYDYIVGDFAYDKVRLKGYYDSSNKLSILACWSPLISFFNVSKRAVKL